MFWGNGTWFWQVPAPASDQSRSSPLFLPVHSLLGHVTGPRRLRDHSQSTTQLAHAQWQADCEVARSHIRLPILKMPAPGTWRTSQDEDGSVILFKVSSYRLFFFFSDWRTVLSLFWVLIKNRYEICWLIFAPHSSSLSQSLPPQNNLCLFLSRTCAYMDIWTKRRKGKGNGFSWGPHSISL